MTGYARRGAVVASGRDSAYVSNHAYHDARDRRETWRPYFDELSKTIGTGEATVEMTSDIQDAEGHQTIIRIERAPALPPA